MRCVGVALNVLPGALNAGLFLSPEEILSCCGDLSRSAAPWTSGTPGFHKEGDTLRLIVSNV